ncbi:c-type cytochrome [Pedobacter sp. HMF7647]|uniref:C-type cytochrome n=1 Tax=Hufsiella arboris TaxID=2695275 RepID=A0A7K1Y8T6_9SPHI|nr:cytochrome c [Hufsiella arboris]MXV50987.1 c-type cytochrome [Hufsiella arboris]
MRFFLAFVFLSTCFSINAQTKKASTAKTSVTAVSSIAAGKAVYTQYCVTCHQANGGGVPNLNPPLIKTSQVLGEKTKLINILLKGLDTHEEINGDTYENVMPSQSFLTDKQIADVLTYVRNSFGNKASAVVAADVKTARAKIK